MEWPQDWTSEERDRLLAWAAHAHQKQSGHKVVLATGAFDLLHEEHREFLRKAKAAGDILLVGVESDLRVAALKGPGRPVHSQDQRKMALEALPEVDAVCILPEAFSQPQHHVTLIDVLRPDILAVSSHSPHQEKKAAILERFGGTLQVVHEHNPAVSTTMILQHRS